MKLPKLSELKVSYLGPQFTFSHEAALRLFKGSQLFYKPTPDKIFNDIKSEEMDFGIIPVENSSTGIVTEFYPLLLEQGYLHDKSLKVRVVGELYLPIYHHLLVRGGISRTSIKRLYTHRQPLLQSANFIQRELPWLKEDEDIVIVRSSAAAAEMLKQDPEGACIGGNLLAFEEKLTILAKDIQDYSKNVTRFFVISSKYESIGKHPNKSTFSIIIPNRVGALVKVLTFLSESKVNILAVKTFPVRESIALMDELDWFIIDVDKPVATDEFREFQRHLDANRDAYISIKIFGSYYSERHSTDSGSEKRKQHRIEKVGSLKDIIDGGESDRVEFKSSLRYDYKTKSANTGLTSIVVKTVAGFMNSDGGYLFIGVKDDGTILGIENDFETLREKNLDKFQLTFYQSVTDAIGKEFSHAFKFEAIKIDGKTIACIKINRSEKPVWVSEGSEVKFYIRSGNATQPLNSKEANEFLLSRLSQK